MMLGFVLGKRGDLQAFFTALKSVGGQLTTAEHQLLEELVHLARHPGSTVNLAQKLDFTSAELADHLTQLKHYGLIDYWTKQSTTKEKLPALLIK